ncbi:MULTISPECIES: TRAP transporter substrate-binding protein [unclassified Desulfovibrio]|uniref:TRAP transporter substrate-binding protein n=1 Tax=unclassified Desulfovibrio TaxID=2593640 RepID=UPI000F5F1A11|nr:MULTISPECIES: TRAP transporter substrate-binding protein [unclassified Desulfovibrio]RRD69947.1 TRAP transporter substrate-binding protein [Desulfovibrio sp. OH1209_COT-279]RRD86515.1 TRAP transporter substrate-binding protein [Desulfovibrio sp. OH1186_COT-070]
MKRIFGIISALCLIGLAAASLCPTVQAAPKVIKIAFSNFPDHPQGQAFALFKKEMESRSKGAFKVELIDSGKFGNPESIVQGLQMGVLQIGAESTSNFSQFNPHLMLFDMPYLIPSYEAADLVLDGPVGTRLAAGLEKNGCLGLGYMELGFRNVFSIRPVRSLEDNKGLKIRATPSKAHIAILRSLGMSPTPMAWGEVYTALQQKTIDGIDVDLNLGWFWRFSEITRHLTLSRHFYTPHLVLISKRFWDALSPDDQELIKTVMKEAIVFERAKSRANEKDFIVRLKSELGMEIIELSPQELRRWMDAAHAVPLEFSKSVPTELVQSVISTIKDAGLYPPDMQPAGYKQ